MALTGWPVFSGDNGFTRRLHRFRLVAHKSYDVASGKGQPVPRRQLDRPKDGVRSSRAPGKADNPPHSFSITRLPATAEIYWQMGRAIFHKSAPNLMIPLQSLRMRADEHSPETTFASGGAPFFARSPTRRAMAWCRRPATSAFADRGRLARGMLAEP